MWQSALSLTEHNFQLIPRAAFSRIIDFWYEPDLSRELTLARDPWGAEQDGGLGHSVWLWATTGKGFHLDSLVILVCLFICTVGVVKIKGKWQANVWQEWEDDLYGSCRVQCSFGSPVFFKIDIFMLLFLIWMHFPWSCSLRKELGRRAPQSDFRMSNYCDSKTIRKRGLWVS